MIYSLLTTELCLFSSSVLMHKHMHTSVEHTHVHTMSILASMSTLVIPNLEYPADLQPDTDYSSCKHWQLFSDCLHLPQPPSPLNSYQTHGWDIPWLVAWSEFLHRSVFNRPWPRRLSSTWPFFALMTPLPTTLSPLCSVCFSQVGLLSFFKFSILVGAPEPCTCYPLPPTLGMLSNLFSSILKSYVTPWPPFLSSWSSSLPHYPILFNTCLLALNHCLSFIIDGFIYNFSFFPLIPKRI